MFRKFISFVMAMCLVFSAFVFYSSAEDAVITSITDIDLASVSKVYFKGETNKDFTSYDVGEEMIFTVTMYADSRQITAPYFYYTLKGDDGFSDDGYISGSSGEIKIKASVSRPGAVLLTVTPCDVLKQPIVNSKITDFAGGAMAGAEDIRTTDAEPADFMEFWNETLMLLDDPEIDFIYEYEYTSGGVTYDAMELEISVPADDYYVETYPQLWAKDGERHYVYAYVSVPRGATAGTLPLDVTFYGRDKIVPSLSVNPGKITVTVGPHCVPASHNVASGEAPHGNDYYTALDTEYSYRSNLGFEGNTNEIADTCYFKYMHLRNVQALRFVMQCFGADGFYGLEEYKGLWNGYTKVSGQSQGGMQSLAVAALCPEVNEVSVTVPWFGDVAGNNDKDKLQSTLRPAYRAGLSYMDSANFAKHIKAEKVTITAGTCDTLCPMSAVQAIYNNLNTNASIKFIQGMGHASTNTYRINSEKSKAYDEDPIEYIDAFYVGDVSDEFKNAFSAAWETVNGRGAVLYSNENEFLSAESDGKHYIAVTSFGDEASRNKNELLNFVNDNGIDSYNAVFTEGAALSEYDKAVLSLSRDVNSAFNVISIFENEQGIALARKIAEDLSGVLFDNQISVGRKLTVIGENGNAIGGIAVADSVENFEAFPVIIPAYELEEAALETEYTFSDGVGSYKISGDGIDREINVFSEDDVEIYGNDGGFDYIVSGKTLNIYGNGAVDSSDYAWNAYISEVEEIIINTGVTSIGANAFDVPAGALVKLPYTALNIDANAFCGKDDFSIIGYSGSGAENVGAGNFTSLGSVGACGDDVYYIYNNGTLEILGTGSRLESGISSYGGYKNCAWYAHYNDITKVIVGENITTIVGRAFHYMHSLTTVEITENLTEIGSSSFEGGPALTTVYVKGNEAVSGVVDLSFVTSIGGGAFNDCKKIKKFILSEELSGAIGSNTFQLCSGIDSLTIPEGVTSIGSGAFGDASGLRTLTILGRNTVISASAFKSNWTPDLIKNVKIVAYSGSVAQGLARSEGLVFENIETGKITDYGASQAQFMTFEGYQVRVDEYNGLRSLFTVDKSRLPTFEDEGYEVVEYGTVMASEQVLDKYGEELEISVSDDGSVSKAKYASLIPIFRNGKIVGKLITNTAEEASFACTIVDFSESNFDKSVVIRGYAVIKDAYGNYSVHYSDYASSEYSAVSLEEVTDGLFEAGAIDESCISYIHVESFRKIRDDQYADDNEFDPDSIFP